MRKQEEAIIDVVVYGFTGTVIVMVMTCPTEETAVELMVNTKVISLVVVPSLL